ncbi:spore coat polysaccharide biosynthesis protein SPSA chain a [Babesia gibsoni]|uniref:UDP-N-acetylglucosamine diphosphorylase n=1 Tax=Babesia gibsoni TaxID=33632 RepID=A0AAD8LI34_BABGI|nr:spore coat polysaccharide biosynthesis protein SPSA chain a [Babesia gibsoni]
MTPDYKQLLREALAHQLDGPFSSLPVTSVEDMCNVPDACSVVRKPDPEQCDRLFQDGILELRSGIFALVILSGGQGSRVGASFPKALLPISPVKSKTLLQLHIERVKRICVLLGNDCPKPKIFIMTSFCNHNTIREYLESMDYFGLGKDQFSLVMQANVPCLSMKNEDFLPSSPSSRYSITTHDCADYENIVYCSNGNGAVFEALSKCQDFMDIIDRLKMLHVIAIDNSLSRPLDPVLIGLSTRLPGLEILNKCIRKYDNENLGVFCIGKTPCIIEYSELEKLPDSSFLRDGEVTLYGNICDHMFSGAFLKRVIDGQLYRKLTYHVAKKAVPYYDENLKMEVRPKQPNVYKLELFIFDIFQFASRIMCLEVERLGQFAPVKYLADCDPSNEKSAQHKMSNTYKAWLESVGAKIGCGFVEISPSLSYCGEGLEEYRSKHIDGPVYLE